MYGRKTLLSFGIMLCGLLAQAQQQSDVLTIQFDDLPLENVLRLVAAKTGYSFSYNSDILPSGSRYTMDTIEEPVDQFLTKLLQGTGLTFSFYNDQIILKRGLPRQVSVRKKHFFQLTGRITDKSGTPLPDVSVFLNGTSIGTSTDDRGEYSLSRVPPGYYAVVFSHISYENVVRPITENSGQTRVMNEELTEKVTNLYDVEIRTNRGAQPDEKWKKYYADFQKELIGESANARQCVIENPEIIQFSYDVPDERLEVFAQSPIIIRNEALGYRIYYFLESFTKSGQDVRYRGQVQYKNMVPENGRERRRWAKNRKESYRGSFNHFKKALIADRLQREGFKMYQLNALRHIELNQRNQAHRADVLSTVSNNQMTLSFRDYLIVAYTREAETRDYLQSSPFAAVIYKRQMNRDGVLMKPPDSQISGIRLLKKYVQMDISGQIIDRFALTKYGLWAWERTGDAVPLNYHPKYDRM